jgi:hypothetical protein
MLLMKQIVAIVRKRVTGRGRFMVDRRSGVANFWLLLFVRLGSEN